MELYAMKPTTPWLKNTKRTTPRVFHDPNKLLKKGPFTYTCVGCKLTFNDGRTRSQRTCKTPECRARRFEQYNKMQDEGEVRTCKQCKAPMPNMAHRNADYCKDECRKQAKNVQWRDCDKSGRDEAPEGSGAHLTNAKANAIFAEKHGDYADFYYNAGLTPRQQKDRLARNAARFAEIMAGIDLVRAKGKS